MLRIALCFVIGYIFGTVNPAALLAKYKHHDLTKTGTGNLGATNAMLAFGVRYGALVLTLDLLKAFAAVKLADILFPQSPLYGLVAGLGAVIGHSYPCQMKFKGGKGSACFAGVVLASQPLLFPILLIVCISLALLADYAFFVPISAVLLFPVLAGWRTHSLSVVVVAALIGLVIILKHKENFAALKNGTEGRFRTWFLAKIRAKRNS